MELLLVTSTWPNVAVPEFLDDEIHHLVTAFDRVVVAPMRPKGSSVSGLPPTLEVDYSLAEHLERTRFTPNHPSRRLTAATRVTRPNRHGFGFTLSELARDWRDPSWIRSSLMSRADATSVATWAAKSRSPDIAYTFWLGGATVGLRDAWPHLPIVSRVHGGDLYPAQHGWGSIPFQQAGVRSVALLASVSDNGREYLANSYPEMGTRLVLRRLGIRDVGGLAASSNHTALRMLSASSIDSNKRVTLIGQVARELACSGRPVEWTHLGDGPGRAEVEQLRAQAPTSLEVDMRGHVPLDEVHRELRSGEHDVFLNLSLSEGAPVSLMEAQCVGLPVVATAVGGTPEVVPAELNELVSPGDSISSLCDAVVRAIKRPADEAQARRDRWAQLYLADANYSSWAEELRGLAHAPRSRI